MTSAGKSLASHTESRLPAAAAFGVELVVAAIAYFVLAKLGLALASIHPNATPIWPPSGFALALLLLRGYRLWPAIFAAAFLANVLTAGTVATSLAIAGGNTLEALLGAYLVNRWSGGRDTFETPAGIVRFVFIGFLPTMLSASIGAGSLALGGFADGQSIGSIWLTWWLGDLAGLLVITPVIVLWATSDRASLRGRELLELLAVFAAAAAIGLIAFSPLLEPTARRAPLGFLTVLPLLWSALRRGQRDTATVALILSCFAIWGALVSGGAFQQTSLNESFLLVLMFMIATAVPSLALSADAAARRRTEGELRRIQEELNQRVDLRTAALLESNRALQEEVEHRKQVEAELKEQRLHLVEAQRLANLGSFVRDVQNNRLVWSDQLFDLYGVKRENFAGTFEVVPHARSPGRPRSAGEGGERRPAERKGLPRRDADRASGWDSCGICRAAGSRSRTSMDAWCASSAFPRTSPSARRPRRRWSAPASNWPKCRRWRRSGSSPAASPTTSTIS